jgi:ribonuclease D
VLWSPPKAPEGELESAVSDELLRLGARQWQVDLMAPLIAEAIRHPAEPEPEPAPEPAPVETDGQPEAS